MPLILLGRGQRAEGGGSLMFKAILVYRENSRTQRNPVSKRKKVCDLTGKKKMGKGYEAIHRLKKKKLCEEPQGVKFSLIHNQAALQLVKHVEKLLHINYRK
jgi:hypothetical protein